MEFNKGTLLIYSIIEFEKIQNNILLITKEEIKTYIISEVDIKENNQNIRIINSYEEYIRENMINEYGEGKENEKEIEDNFEIRINDEIIKFCYFYDFKEKGIYNIKYIFKNNIKHCNHMFYDCDKLTKINLSNFNTNNVTNMGCMFS